MNKPYLWPFAKYVGCGNDFIFFDNREQKFPAVDSAIIKKLCHRQFGIGADGIILLETSQQADGRMRIFNADGSEAEMCGNGLRCFVKWMSTLGFEQSSYRIETLHGLIKADLKSTCVSVDMGIPQDIQWNKPLNFLDQSKVGHYLNTGVPHLVLFVDDVEKVPVEEWGGALRYHPSFEPQGTNVNFVQIVSNQKIKVRTYERGVEGETLACGTGATAAALAVAYHYQASSPIEVGTRAKENLTIDFLLTNQTFSQVSMLGSARCTYRGEVDLNEFLYSEAELASSDFCKC